MRNYKYIFNAKDIDEFKFCPYCGSEIIEVYTGDHHGNIMCSNDDCEGMDFEIVPEHYLYIQRNDNMVFYIDSKQKRQIDKWDKHKGTYSGAVGGRLSYEFVPTSIGTFVGVKCARSGRVLKFDDV